MIRKIFCSACACVLSACCSSRPDHPGQLAQVPIIFAALKCAFASALIKERDSIRRLEGAVAAGTLTLKLVHTGSTDLGLKAVAAAEGPFVFPLGGATGSITPSISRGVKRTDTITTEVPFRFLLRAEDDRVCSNLSQSQRAKIGLSDWLANLIDGLNFNMDYDPPGQVDSIKFTQDFAVTATTKGGVDFNFVFLSASAGASSERNDVQNLTFTIAPRSDANPAPSGT